MPLILATDIEDIVAIINASFIQFDFSSSIKPKKTLPFTTPIFYLNEKNKTKIILANHQIESVLGYTFLLLGMIILCVVMFIQLS